MKFEISTLDLIVDLFSADTKPDKDGIPTRIPVLPSGKKIKARDGRVFTNPNPKAIVEAFNKDPINLPIDVDHSSEWMGGPAHGWIDELQTGKGGSIWGIPQWNDSGIQFIKSRAYRYVSPAIFHDESGEIKSFSSVALVNRPALTMPALSSHQSEESEPMDKKILAALSLPDDATTEQALTAIAKIVNTDKTPPLDQYVPRADYETACAAAKDASKALADREATEKEAAIVSAVDDACKAGKVTPAQREQALGLARSAGLKAFASFIDAAPKLAEPTDLSTKKPNNDQHGTHGLNAEEIQVCSIMRIDPKDFAETKKGN